MRGLEKVDRITVRLTPAQRRDLKRAAEMVSRRRGEIVEESALLRELAMEKVIELLRPAA